MVQEQRPNQNTPKNMHSPRVHQSLPMEGRKTIWNSLRMQESAMTSEPTASAINPDLNTFAKHDDKNVSTRFGGLNLKSVWDAYVALRESTPLKEPAAPVTEHRVNMISPAAQRGKGLFTELNLAEVAKHLPNSNSPPARQPPNKSAPNTAPLKTEAPEVRSSNILTADVIASLIRAKKHKRVKESTLKTYRKKLHQFQVRYTYLPTKSDDIMEYLGKFNGPTGRHLANHQDLLNMLYEHAVKNFGLPKNPIVELEKPLVTHKPIKTLTMSQVLAIFGIPLSLNEEVALDLALGHGWRQIEIRRIQAKDVQAIENHMILCHGKEREELAPILPETEKLLHQFALSLAPDDFLFRAKQTRHGRRAPLGEDGMSRLLGRLMARAGIEGFTPHDLRRTFATLVTIAGNDELLAMRLIRDNVPGLSNRYIRYPLDQLYEALLLYSPKRQVGEILAGQNDEIDNKKVPTVVKPSPVSEAGDVIKTTTVETKKSLVETGEGRTPRPEKAARNMLQA